MIYGNASHKEAPGLEPEEIISKARKCFKKLRFTIPGVQRSFTSVGDNQWKFEAITGL